MHVVIAEDDRVTARLLTSLVTGWGYETVVATAKSTRADLVEGLDAGADEYLLKPIEPGELRARLNAGGRILDLQTRPANQVCELQAALGNIRHLTGLLPTCAYCKSIRDGFPLLAPRRGVRQ